MEFRRLGDSDLEVSEISLGSWLTKDDPSYSRLVNWSWTYDSSVSAAAFVATDEKQQATQLLDQLAVLQFKDGSIDIAFNVATGEGAKTFRAGSVAWLGLAATSFDLHFGSDRYLDSSRRAANYLLGLQEANGLVRGGPKIKWFSTQHNLLAYTFLVRLSSELKGVDDKASDRYLEAAKRISEAIDSELLVTDGSGPHFIEGLNDSLQPLDVQAIGAMYLAGRGEGATANGVLDGARAHFALGPRSIRLSDKIATYNMTWAAPGPFNGYRPYYAKGSPEVICSRATPRCARRPPRRAATPARSISRPSSGARSPRKQPARRFSPTAPSQARATASNTTSGPPRPRPAGGSWPSQIPGSSQRRCPSQGSSPYGQMADTRRE
ncbi:MAG: hypothetical protein EXQ70_09810 [Solirubrobacterales bacterium]|nr:hypothetical protein [Solirubrobacterales bacterium]